MQMKTKGPFVLYIEQPTIDDASTPPNKLFEPLTPDRLLIFVKCAAARHRDRCSVVPLTDTDRGPRPLWAWGNGPQTTSPTCRPSRTATSLSRP